MKSLIGVTTQSCGRLYRQGQTAGIVLAISLVAGLLAPPAGAENFGTEIADAFKDGEFDLNFRYRYEFVDQDSLEQDANASTVRTRLVYKSAEYQNMFVTLNLDDVHTVVANNYNSTRNDKTQYPVVADPKGTDLNLASITFTGLEDGNMVFGRQRIIRENSRFVGNVGWRQNEQTFDSASIDYAFTDKFQAFYSYVDRVKRIFGPEDGAPPEDFRSNSHLIDTSYSFSPLFRVFGYAYLLDLKNADNLSSKTYGLRLTGKQQFGDGLAFSYAAEYATQKDYKDNPIDYDEGYYVVEAGLDWEKLGFKAGYEVLEGNGNPGESFKTPLATLHKFNGLADQFLATPDGGIEDIYIQGTAKALGGKFSLVYHDFRADSGSDDYGTELDFIAKWSFLENYSVLAGFAVFDVDSDTPIASHSDTTKGWLMLTAAF
jgi:hypothetical protein